MGTVIRLPLPREFTARAIIPIRADLYDRAYRTALDAGADWPAMLGYAQTLSHSPLPAHTSLARHIRTSYSLHMADLLKPVDPARRDRADMIGEWKEAANRAAVEETSVQIAMRHRPELLAVCTGMLLAVLVAVAFNVAVV
jgi:hypothetical protein